MISAAYSQGTWNKHEAANNSFKNYLLYAKKNVTWPLSSSDISEYITWAMDVKRLKMSTISSYLDSLRFLHSLSGQDTASFESTLVRTMVRGGENLELYRNDVKATRKAMSLELLKLIGHEISKTEWPAQSKQVVWAVCTTAFFGSFRLGELLSKKEESFNPNDTLLWKDVKILSQDHMLIHVKTPKSRAKEGEFVDLFSIEGHNVCPVKGMAALKSLKSDTADDTPVFMFSSGKCLTQSSLNNLIAGLLLPHLGAASKQISGHSFRAAIPTVLAKHPELANCWEIMGWGRWKSRAFEDYTRLPLNKRRATFNKIVALFNM